MLAINHEVCVLEGKGQVGYVVVDFFILLVVKIVMTLKHLWVLLYLSDKLVDYLLLVLLGLLFLVLKVRSGLLPLFLLMLRIWHIHLMFLPNLLRPFRHLRGSSFEHVLVTVRLFEHFIGR